MEKPVAGKDVALQKQETSTHNAMCYELPLNKVGCHLRPQNKVKNSQCGNAILYVESIYFKEPVSSSVGHPRQFVLYLK